MNIKSINIWTPVDIVAQGKNSYVIFPQTVNYSEKLI